MEFKKKLIFLFLLVLLPLASAVTFENQTTLQKITNSSSYIRMEQDTIATRWDIDPTKDRAEIWNISTLDSLFTNLNTTGKSYIKFVNFPANKSVVWGNGTILGNVNVSNVSIAISPNDFIFLSNIYFNSSGSGGTTIIQGGSGQTVGFPVRINLTDLNILSNFGCLEDNYFNIRFEPLNYNDTFEIIDSAILSIDDVQQVADLIVDKGNKTYSFRIPQINQSTYMFNITAIEEQYEVSRSKEIEIKVCNPVEQYLEDNNSLYNKILRFLRDYKTTLIYLGMFLVFGILMFLIYKLKKKK